MRRLRGALRVVADVAIGLAMVAALAACTLAWRLTQGPLDITWLLQRERARLSIPDATLHLGSATLAWRGFAAGNQPLDIGVQDVSISAPGDGPRGHVASASIGLPIGPLLFGRIAPRAISARGVELELRRGRNGALALGQGTTTGRVTGGGFPSWPAQLRHLHVNDGVFVVRDQALGVVWRMEDLRVAMDQTDRATGGVAGSAQATLRAGDVTAAVDLHLIHAESGTRLSASLAPVNPAAIARLSPSLAMLGALDAPVGLTSSAEFGPGLAFAAGHLTVQTGAGRLAAGRGAVGLAPSGATASLTPAELRLDGLRLAMAQAPGTSAPPPVFTGHAAATRAAGRVHATFAVDLAQASMADLGRYWPEGVGGGARPWLVQNVTAGHAHAAHVEGSVEGTDLSDMTIGALSGGLLMDDATVWWLRPMPPLIHAGGRVVVEGPDSLMITLDRASQDRLSLGAGSIHITKLEEPHQFGDIAADLSGPLADALALLNHPRLQLLSRAHVDVVGASGSMRTHLTLHIPLEDHVTMDQIPVTASAALTEVHLGRIVAGRDLDHAALDLKVTGDGLELGGRGEVATIPARLGLQMDFRDGPPSQVLQHLSVQGSATSAQLAAAGAPEMVASVLAGGTAGLSVDYAGHRNGKADIRLAADLSKAALDMPFGWSKPSGPAASLGAHVQLDHDRLAGVDQLHAEGPGLVVASRAQLAPGRPRVLLLDHVQLGQTDLHGRVTFSGGPGAPLAVALSGPVLDLSAYLAKPASAKPEAPAPANDAPDTAPPGQPWAADLAFDRVLLAPGRSVAHAVLRAQDDGRHITQADASAGDPGTFSASIAAAPAGRSLTVRAQDAGVVLHAAGLGDNLTGGKLALDATFADRLPGSPLSGTATMEQFQVHQAPAVGRLIQAMTLYGLVDALRGPGLRFSKLVAPFRWQRRVLTLHSARAFSPSLGITAQGEIDLRRHVADLRGTVVPAYFFNQLLGDLPIVGRVFSPEKGGGVFAARYSVRGPLADPKIGVNPLAALTPGFLREGFGLFAPSTPPAGR